MENNHIEYSEAIEKSSGYIQAIQTMGFEISYRHLVNSEQEIKFTKKEIGPDQGMEMSFIKIIPSKEVLNPVNFVQHLEKIHSYLKEKSTS